MASKHAALTWSFPVPFEAVIVGVDPKKTMFYSVPDREMNQLLSDALSRYHTLYRRGALCQARVLLEDLLEEQTGPEKATVWALHGLLLSNLGEHELSISSFEAAASISPLMDDQKLILAETRLANRDVKLGRKLFLNLAEHNTIPLQHTHRLALGLMKTGMPLQALQVCRDAVHRESDEPDLYYTMAQLMSGLGYSPGAVLSALKVSVSLAPDEIMYRIALAAHLARFRDASAGYQVIQHFTHRQIRQLSCRRCIGFLKRICETVGDDDLARVCRNHERQCQLQNCSGNNCCRSGEIRRHLSSQIVNRLCTRKVCRSGYLDEADMTATPPRHFRHSRQAVQASLLGTRGKLRLGFTLLELLIVVAVMAVIAGAAIVLLGETETRGEQQLATSEIGELKKALLRFRKDTGYFPTQGPFNLSSRAGGFVPQANLPDYVASGAETAWFDCPANFWQLFQNPLSEDRNNNGVLDSGEDTNGNGAIDIFHSLGVWNPDSGRGWHGPYLSRTGNGYVRVGASLLTNGSGSPAAGAVVADVVGVADPYVKSPLTASLYLQWLTAPTVAGSALSRWGRPFLLLAPTVPTSARLMSMGANGTYESDATTTGGDDIAVFLLR